MADSNSESILVNLGILNKTKISKKYEWLTDVHKHVLITLYLSGEMGVAKASILKILKKDDSHLIALDMADYIKWEMDNRGKKSHLVLTWKGDEVAKELYEVAKNESKHLS